MFWEKEAEHTTENESKLQSVLLIRREIQH